MNKITASLLKKLPRQYHAVVDSMEVEGGLIDNCKYMLYIAAPYDENDLLGGSVPVRNLTEAVQYVKDAHANYEAMQRAEKAEAIIEKLDPRLKDNKRYNLYYGMFKLNSRVIDGTIHYNEPKAVIMADLLDEIKKLRIDEFGAEALSLCQITPYSNKYYERQIAYITAYDLEGGK